MVGMKYKSYNGSTEIFLKNCPFCGGEPVVEHLGNNFKQRKKVIIKCRSCCIKRIDATLGSSSFEQLEKVSAESWNKRYIDSTNIESIKKLDT